MNFIEDKVISRLKNILQSNKDNRTRLDLEYLVKNLKFEFLKNFLQKFGELIAFSFLKSIFWKEYKKGEFIYKTNEYSNHCYILFKGSVDYCTPLATGKAILRGLLKPNKNRILFSIKQSITEGSLFGEIEITERKNRNYTAVCTSDCIVGEMSKQDYISIFENTKRLEMNEEMKFLNATQLFINSTGINVKKFLIELDKKLYKHGDIVIRQGEPLNSILLIRKGQFEVVYKHIDNFKCDYNSKYLNDEVSQRFTANRVYELKDEVNMIEQHKVIFVYLDDYIGSWGFIWGYRV
jgi:CRP-like cAMP-binding protein